MKSGSPTLRDNLRHYIDEWHQRAADNRAKLLMSMQELSQALKIVFYQLAKLEAALNGGA